MSLPVQRLGASETHNEKREAVAVHFVVRGLASVRIAKSLNFKGSKIAAYGRRVFCDQVADVAQDVLVALPERRRHVTAVDVSKIGEIAFAG